MVKMNYLIHETSQLILPNNHYLAHHFKCIYYTTYDQVEPIQPKENVESSK